MARAALGPRTDAAAPICPARRRKSRRETDDSDIAVRILEWLADSILHARTRAGKGIARRRRFAYNRSRLRDPPTVRRMPTTIARRLQLSFALILTCAAIAGAQQRPTGPRIDPPGPRVIVGVVIDTAGYRVDSAEVLIR